MSNKRLLQSKLKNVTEGVSVKELNNNVIGFFSKDNVLCATVYTMPIGIEMEITFNSSDISKSLDINELKNSTGHLFFIKSNNTIMSVKEILITEWKQDTENIVFKFLTGPIIERVGFNVYPANFIMPAGHEEYVDKVNIIIEDSK